LLNQKNGGGCAKHRGGDTNSGGGKLTGKSEQGAGEPTQWGLVD